jgi:hypothetical protein
VALRAYQGHVSLFYVSNQFKFGLTVQAGVFINGHNADDPYLPIFDRIGLILEFYRKDW